MTEAIRKPATFEVDDPRLVIEPVEPSRPARAGEDTATEAGAIASPAPPAEPMRGVPWGTLFWSACSGLLVLVLGLAVTRFVEELFTLSPWLGAVGLALGVIAGLALAILVSREVVGLIRLRTVEALRARAARTIESDDREQGRALVSDLMAQLERVPQLARARATLKSHLSEIIDGRDLVRIAERELMAPLDAQARQLVAAAGKRVSVVTAVSPRAAIDIAFVLVNALVLIRKLAVLYGGRPGTLGVLKLFRRVLSHLAVTGGIAITDSVLQQLVGHGLAAKLSARLGEGMLNGLLTARLGLLAIDLVRPLPFCELPRPSLNDLAGSLLRPADGPGDRGGRPRPPTAP